MVAKELGNIIKETREKANLTQLELILKLKEYDFEVTQSGLSKYENNVNYPTIEFIRVFSKICNVSPLIFIDNVTENNFQVMTNKIPVYGRIPAGTPFEAIQDLLEDVEIPSWLAEKKDLFGLKVVGDSMNKVLPDGAIAVLQRTSELNNGEIGAILVNGFDATLKKFYKLTDSIVLEPLSYNPENKPIVFAEGSQEVRPIGKLLWYCAGEVM